MIIEIENLFLFDFDNENLSKQPELAKLDQKKLQLCDDDDDDEN